MLLTLVGEDGEIQKQLVVQSAQFDGHFKQALGGSGNIRGNPGRAGLGFVTGLRTCTGNRVRVGRVRVRVTPKAPAENPHPQGGFGGFLI